MIVFWCQADHQSEVSPQEPVLSGFNAKASELYVDGTKTLSSYTLLILAGIGYFVQLIFTQPNATRVTAKGRLLLVAAVFLCVISMLSGYASYSHLIDLFVAQLSFNPYLARLYWFHELQLWSFVSSLVLFGVFSIEALLSDDAGGKP